MADVRLERGTWVRTAAELQPRDFSQEVQITRRRSAIGVVMSVHDSHGLCYGVQHTDGTRSAYDHDEVEVVNADRERAVKKVLYALRNQLVMMSVPDREEALWLAETYAITATDLLSLAYARASSS